jgi:hypothetical protein
MVMYKIPTIYNVSQYVLWYDRSILRYIMIRFAPRYLSLIIIRTVLYTEQFWCTIFSHLSVNVFDSGKYFYTIYFSNFDCPISFIIFTRCKGNYYTTDTRLAILVRPITLQVCIYYFILTRDGNEYSCEYRILNLILKYSNNFTALAD